MISWQGDCSQSCSSLFLFSFSHSFLLTCFLFTFGLSKSISISLCTGKIHYHKQERGEKAGLHRDLQACFCRHLSFWGQGPVLPSIKYLWYQQPLVVAANGGKGWYDNPKEYKVPSDLHLIWQCITIKPHEFNLIRKKASLDQ